MTPDDDNNPLHALVRERQGEEHAQRAEQAARLAEAHRVWCDAFNAAGGALAGSLKRGLPLEFYVEHLARAKLHDAIALVCDGADCNLLAYARQQLALVAGEPAAAEAAATLVQAYARDRASQKAMLEAGGTYVRAPSQAQQG